MMKDHGDKTKEQTMGVDIEALDDTMEEVVETLDMAAQAAEFVQERSPDPTERARAAEIQQQAEAMLNAAEERSSDDKRPDPRGDQRTVH